MMTTRQAIVGFMLAWTSRHCVARRGKGVWWWLAGVARQPPPHPFTPAIF
ncbi:hypothetical protein [Ktedonobacter sp. SOSP1-85]|nr:hypothetical protein [Ktedonobacter sp. SOSP1-85]